MVPTSEATVLHGRNNYYPEVQNPKRKPLSYPSPLSLFLFHLFNDSYIYIYINENLHLSRQCIYEIYEKCVSLYEAYMIMKELLLSVLTVKTEAYCFLL